MIDILFKIEANMPKVTIEVKAIIDAKWTKCLEDLDTIKNATWLDIELDIVIWELIGNIKALPSQEDY